jgi:bifunctional DNA-binding transcriptional regulator/antitoxin component of YhaV-PrlF toxin-antitoxin module
MVRELKARRVRIDSKGRICLPKALWEGVSSFSVVTEPGGRIVLEPYAEIPARELWLHQNPAALEQVQRGISQAAAGKSVDRGSFAHYAEGADDDGGDDV